MCILIGLQVCFHSAMKDKNDVSNVVASVSKLWEVTVSWKKFKVNIQVSNKVFLFIN